MIRFSQWVSRLANPLLNQLNGWKSILGVLVALVAMVLDELDIITPEVAAQCYEVAKVVFEVGIIHRVLKLGSGKGGPSQG